MPSHTEQAKIEMQFPGLDFPGRTTLYPHECAARLVCHVKHIYDLIEEGELRAMDISGRNNLTDRRSIRIPIEGWRAFIAARTTV